LTELRELLLKALKGCPCSPCFDEVNTFENDEIVSLSRYLHVPFFHGFYIPPNSEMPQTAHPPGNLDSLGVYCLGDVQMAASGTEGGVIGDGQPTFEMVRGAKWILKNTSSRGTRWGLERIMSVVGEGKMFVYYRGSHFSLCVRKADMVFEMVSYYYTQKLLFYYSFVFYLF
jgi:hypothetical protein